MELTEEQGNSRAILIVKVFIVHAELHHM